MLTISLTLAGNMVFSVGGDDHATLLDARKKVCEALAVQLSSLVTRGNIESVEATLDNLVRRNEDVLSAALRDARGGLLVEAGVHQRYWVDIARDKSTPTHAQVPIFDVNKRWGTVEVRFTPLIDVGMSSLLRNPFVQFLLFLSVLGFFAYLLFMKRTLKHLDPSAVIPPRVRQTLDILTEGVVLVDKSSDVLMANTAFVNVTGRSGSSLMGRRLSNMGWCDSDDRELVDDSPWQQAIASGQSKTGVMLRLPGLAGEVRSFLVSGSPILDARSQVLGALVTFEDQTELERRNKQLEDTVQQLEASRDEVEKQNQRLHILATRDPMTNCLNRRAFFECLEQEFTQAERDGLELSCIMADIDHFKSVNDTYGHATGDKVIQQFADILRAAIRSVDVVGRYGGEEFCVLLPGLTAEDAQRTAEKIRELTQSSLKQAIAATEQRLVTTSLGVASIVHGATNGSELVDAADKALYHSKTSGRNRVTCWDEVHEESTDAVV